MSTIAILSVSAGAGHVRCAEALTIAAEQRGLKAVHVDVMDLVPRLFRKIYVDSYLSVVNGNPALWGYLYHASDRRRPDAIVNRLRAQVERLNARALEEHLAHIAPDHVVCTHFLPAQLIARLIRKRRFDKPTWVAVTDFDVHALWVHQGMTGYCAAAEEIAWRMRDRGLEATRIAVTGIPIMPAFRERLPREECVRELGLDPARTTFLMMSGGFGVGALDSLSERLLSIPGDHQIIALAGRNAELLGRLHHLAQLHPGRLFPLGFTRTIEKAMACADLAISKPGGLTTAECLAVGLPMLVISPIPGQEERNADYLLENGAALKAHDAAGLEYRVRGLLSQPHRLAALRAQATRLGRPRAADAVLDQVLEPGAERASTLGATTRR
ncbi:MAG: galactosyldiacylglycerol synthase [Planctomycetes bacterium]|nr:galactosyldiacylglycerol synthase [Planctomycetota bacterium]